MVIFIMGSLSMKRWGFFLFVLLLSGCGSEGNFQGQTTVQLDLILPARSGIENVRFSPDMGTSTSPSGVASVSVTVTGPGMEAVFAETPIAADGSAALKLSVPNGTDRVFTVQAKNSSGIVLYSGSSTASLTGGTIALPIQLSVNTPEFIALAITPNNGECFIGRTFQYVLEGELADESIHNLADAAIWSSSAAPTAAVSSKGLVSCDAAGTTTITAQLGLKTATTTLTVVPRALVKGVSAGGFHTCAFLEDGTARCWGLHVSGQLGDGKKADADNLISTTPVKVSGLTGVVEVAAGGFHSCARLENGEVWCWGLNTFGQLGNGATTSTSTPVKVSGFTDSTATATAIAAGFDHTCAVLTSGIINCWGYNFSGQLGNGAELKSSTPVSTPVLVGGGVVAAVDVSSQFDHTCARLSDNKLTCWGENGFGQLGNKSTSDSSSPVSTFEAGEAGTTTRLVSAGGFHTCALSSGRIGCVGQNLFGQLGNGQRGPAGAFEVTGITATSVAAGGFHSCAILADGTVQCWGFNLFGQLGNNARLSSGPAPITGLSNVVELSLGSMHSCALLEEGTVRCWGQNSSGQLGDGTADNSPTPVSPSGL